MKSNDEKGKKSYYSLVLWMKSTTPRNPMIIVAGRKNNGNSGTGLGHTSGIVTVSIFDSHSWAPTSSTGIT